MSLIRVIGAVCGLICVLCGLACQTDPQKRKTELVTGAERYSAAGEFGKAIIEYKNALKIEPQSAELQYKLGEAYSQNGQLQEAFLSFRKAADLRPDYAPAQLALGRLYLGAKHFEDATKAAQAVLAKDPDSADANILLTEVYATSKGIPQAIKMLQEVLKRHPDSITAYLDLGVLYTALGKRDEGFQQFEKAVAIDPKSVDAHKTLATYYLSQKQVDKAEEQYRAAVEANPDAVEPLQALAAFYVREGRLSDAEPIYKNLVKLQKNSAQSQFTLAEYYRTTGHADQARQLDEAIAREDPNFLAARLQLAEMALSGQKYDDADRVVSSILKDRPKEPQALILRARISLARSNPLKAVQDLETAQRGEPNVPALHYWKGVAYRVQGNLDLAEHSFQQALSLNQHYVESEIALAELAIDRGRWDEALRYAQEALKDDPRRAAAHYMAGNAYLNLKELPKAEAEFQEFVQLQPSSPKGPARLGYVHLAQQRYDDAEKQFERSLALDPKQIDALNGLVACYRLRGQTDKAITRIRQQIAQGETADVNNLLGQTYAELGQFGPAEQSLKRALELDPQNFNTYALLGGLYFREKATDKAVREFQEAVRVNPKSVGGWTVLGWLHDNLSQFDLAEKDYEAALAIDPNAAVAANNLAWLYCERGGDMDKALELARRARGALPKVGSVSDTLGWVYYKRQLYDSAVPLLQEAVRQQPKDAQIRFHLAASLLATGKKEQAKTELNAALELDNSLRQRDDVRRIFGNI
jgi:tetratricopeptide (TPR) repeat protein